MRLVKRAYIWLICHNLCLCGIDKRLNRATRGRASWLSYWCGRLDPWIWPDEDRRR